MDFIECLSSSLGKNTIMVIGDRFFKFAHFIVIMHPFTAPNIAQIFFYEDF